jgi:hypothetical protein
MSHHATARRAYEEQEQRDVGDIDEREGEEAATAAV